MATKTISKVYLLSVPLENDYKHTLYFNNKTAQEEYFKSKNVKSFTDFSYQRKNNIIRIPYCYDKIYMCNYVMYQNTNYNNKWFYAFIKDMKYINDDVTHIEIETDVIQTWLFDYHIKPSFVEREHVTDDTIGIHTVPEGLETGEYICNSKSIDEKLTDLHIIMAFSDYADGKYEVQGNLYGGIYSGMGYHAYPLNSISHLNNMLNNYDDEAKADGINSIFMAPAFLTASNLVGPATVNPSSEAKSYDSSYSKLTTLNGYTPKNKKLLTYPYVFLRASNNAGNSAIYKQELFSTDEMGFTTRGVLTPGCSIRMEPKSYNGIGLNNDEGINAGKYPICCWNTDVYTNWLTQNSVNVGLGVLGGVGTAVAGGVLMATGAGALAGAGMIAGGVMSIAQTMGQVHEASLTPDQVKGNTNCGDVITGCKQNTFYFYKMSIRNEYAQMIDKYFDMFGYKVNMVKTPNKAHRSRYWYTKTIDVNIDGNIVNEDLQKIKNCYNNGITFWRNANEIQNYDLSNDIAIVE